MQLFYFVLKGGRRSIPDPEGQELPDETAARLHAMVVARQLMRNREVQLRNSRIEVCDDYLHPLFDVFFADIDESLVRYPEMRARVRHAAQTVAAFDRTLSEMLATFREVRQTLARADQVLGSIPRARL